MATSFTIPSLDFGNSTLVTQVVSLEYKLWSSSTWILIDSTVNLDADGNVTDSPLPSVSALIDGELYMVRAANQCASPLEYVIQNIQL